jgi:hypothetical protein
MKIKVTIFAFLLIFPVISYPVDIHTIDKNCNEMNIVAWDRYVQSLEGSTVTGTLTLDSIQDGKDNLLGGWRRWRQALIDLVRDPGYNLFFSNNDIDLWVFGRSEDDVINLKIKRNYKVNYTIKSVKKRDYSRNWRVSRCVLIVAK